MFYFSLIFIPFPFFCLHLRWFPVRLGLPIWLGLPIRLGLSVGLGLSIRLGLSVGLRLSIGGSCGSCCCHVRVVHNSRRLLSLLVTDAADDNTHDKDDQTNDWTHDHSDAKAGCGSGTYVTGRTTPDSSGTAVVKG